jgi:hypothetical protein
VSPSINAPQEELLSPNQAAARLHLSESSMAKMRCRGGGPAYLKFGRSVRYEPKSLDDWLSARRVRNTSDAARLPGRLTFATMADGERPITRDAPAEPRHTPSRQNGGPPLDGIPVNTGEAPNAALRGNPASSDRTL